MRKDSTLKRILMTILILGLTLSLMSLFLLSLLSLEPGLYITLRLYDVDKDKVFDVSSIIQRGDVIWCVKTDVIAPFISENDLVNILNKCYGGSGAAFISYDKIKPVIDSWINTYSLRNADVKGLISGMIISVFVMNISDKNIIFKGFDVYSYKPYEYKDPKPVNIEITMIRGREHMYFITKILGASGLSYLNKASEISPEDIYYTWYKERQITIIMPENLTGILPSDYFQNIGGKTYMKTPVLILENVGSYSGVLMSSVDITLSNPSITVGIYATFTAGDIIEKLRSASLPSVSFRLTDFTWGGNSYYYYRATELYPEEASWLYIYARPIQKYTEYYVCDETGCRKIEDRVYSLITDVWVIGSTIQGGEERGLPHQIIMNNFYSGTNDTGILSIPGTPLDDGKLDPNESINFKQIFPYYDTCGADFEVGIPLGAIVATGICAGLGIPSGGLACTVAMAFASSFHVSLSFKGSSIYIGGGIENKGQYRGAGYNVPVYISMRISRYKYYAPPPWWCFWCSPCEYKVPAGIYFKAYPAS